jgi:hypothetical protein
MWNRESEWKTGGRDLRSREFRDRWVNAQILEVSSSKDMRLQKHDRGVSTSRHIGTRELENRVLGVASSEVAIEAKSLDKGG